MRKDTHGHKPRQRTGLGHLRHGTLHIVVRRKADAAHARVYFQMHPHRHARAYSSENTVWLMPPTASAAAFCTPV